MREDLAATREELEAQVVRLSKMATDRWYMMMAYRSMLGPKGLEVAQMWDDKGVHRVHHSWGPGAWDVDGESRAQTILDWENAPKRKMEPGEIDGHLSPPKEG